MKVKLSRLLGRYTTISQIHRLVMLDPDCIIEFNDGVGEQVLLEIDGMEDGNK